MPYIFSITVLRLYMPYISEYLAVIFAWDPLSFAAKMSLAHVPETVSYTHLTLPTILRV